MSQARDEVMLTLHRRNHCCVDLSTLIFTEIERETKLYTVYKGMKWKFQS